MCVVIPANTLGELGFFKSPACTEEDGEYYEPFFDLMLTDKPYGLNDADGTSSDKAIPDTDVRATCKYWFSKCRDNGTVCVRLYDRQLALWWEALEDAGFTVDRHPTRTEKNVHTNKFQRGGKGMYAVGDVYLVGHKVTIFAMSVRQ